MIEQAAGWIAPAATMIAAMMTAANLGARVTGWGFVVFTFGSVAWTIVGVSSGQTNLIAANSFLTIVNLVGIWRWLGREAKYQDSAVTVADHSEIAVRPTLTPAGQLIGQPVRDARGSDVAHVVDVMIGCDDGRVHALLVRHGGGIGGVGERVVLLDGDRFALASSGITTTLDAERFAREPEVVPA